MDETEPDIEDPLTTEQHEHDFPREVLPEFDAPSPADRLIEHLEKTRIVPGQFRLSTLLWVFLGTAVLLATPRLLGIDLGSFFLLIYAVCYAFAPLVVWAGVNLCTLIPRKLRIGVGAVLMLLLALPMLAILTLDTGLGGAVLGAVCSLSFWIVQVAGLWAIYFLLYRDRVR